MHATEDHLVGALTTLAGKFTVACSPETTTRLAGYAALLERWNARINLTGARSAEQVVSEHFPDAFALAERLGEPARAIDVGSGSGLPAVPLALLRPGLQIRLVEPTAKKAAFLRTAIREANLSGQLQVDNRRIEDVPDRGFDVALSRATFPPVRWIELGRRLVLDGGRIFVLTTAEIARGLGLDGTPYGSGGRALVELRNVPRGTAPRELLPNVPRGTYGRET